MWCFVFGTTDKVIARPFRRVIEWIIKATGLSQYTIARILLLGIAVVETVSDVLHLSPFSLFMDAWFIAWSLWSVSKWEAIGEDLDERQVPWDIMRYRYYRWMRPIIAILTPTHLVWGHWVVTIEDLIILAGCYSMTMFGTRPTPWWKSIRVRLPRLGLASVPT